MQLYKKAGAQYFVAMGNHHDNFDNWDSKYQPWNTVNVGPRKDLIGIWAETARKHGLRFGVTIHSARAWDWLEAAHGSDTEGPLKGVPYDGALTKTDGKGKWWEGLDPADLYCPHGIHRTQEARWAYEFRFFQRVKDMLDKYRPDLLYFDDIDLPCGEAGMNVGAHFYNANLQWNNGRQEAILNTMSASARTTVLGSAKAAAAQTAVVATTGGAVSSGSSGSSGTQVSAVSHCRKCNYGKINNLHKTPRKN